MQRLFRGYSLSLCRQLGLLFSFFMGSFLAACGGAGSSSGSTAPVEVESFSSKSITNAAEIAEQAYILGFPMVEHFKLVRYFLGPDSEIGPNMFLHRDGLATAENRGVVSPNNDTLYSSIILDLRAEPVVITLPEVNDRYFSIQLLNIATENLPLIAAEQEGAAAESFIVAGPNWDSGSFSSDENISIIQSDSSIVLGLLRIGVKNEADVSLAQAYQAQTLVRSYSEYFNLRSPEPLDDIHWPGTFSAKSTNSAEFFKYMNFMMQFHTFGINESEILNSFAEINIEAGKEFSLSDFDFSTQEAIKEGISNARSAIRFPSDFGRMANGWNMPDSRIGNDGDDYVFRAVVAWYGLYALPLSEAAYFGATLDEGGDRLSGDSVYQLHFPAESLPPESYFWSLTIYDENSFLVDNELARYSLGDRSEFLEFNSDGSLTIYLQHTRPGGNLESNWLPAPEGDFRLSFRMYGPDERVRSGDYLLPAIRRVK